ncbi:MAG: hypothetical protein ABH851_09645 [Methanobacteriota archaeon]
MKFKTVFIIIFFLSLLLFWFIYNTSNDLRMHIQEVSTSRKLSIITAFHVNSEMSEREKALTLWRMVSEKTYHKCGGDTNNPLIILDRGFGCCEETAYTLYRLWQVARLPSRICFFEFHTIPEVYYEGEWHMLDPDHKVYYTTGDDTSIASIQELATSNSTIYPVFALKNQTSQKSRELPAEYRKAWDGKHCEIPIQKILAF